MFEFANPLAHVQTVYDNGVSLWMEWQDDLSRILFQFNGNLKHQETSKPLSFDNFAFNSCSLYLLRWLDTGEDDGLIQRELIPATALEELDPGNMASC